MRKLSHNKKRNVGLVYEFLTREVAASAVAKDGGARPRPHCHGGKPLGRVRPLP
jgi:hypothetical protein